MGSGEPVGLLRWAGPVRGRVAMPNLRSQAITSTGITLVASDGRSVSISFAQVRARFLVETGTLAQRRTKTRTWIATEIQNALGAEQVSLGKVTTAFRDADGGITDLTVDS